MASVAVDDATIEVTRRLEAALVRLRHRKKKLRIWADAICIDQRSDEDMNAQLCLMPEIYPKAAKVFCWLGKDDGTARIAFKFLRRWGMALRRGALETQDALRRDVRKKIANDGSKNVCTLAALFGKSWFRRA